MARPGEVAGAIADELQGLTTKQPEWHLPGPRTKNRRPHIVPLSDGAVALIREAMPEDQLVVFRSKYEARASIARNSLSQALIDIRKHLGLIEPFTPHDLRRTAATLARRAGVPRGHVKAMLNHVEEDITAVYDLYSMLAEKRETASILENEVMRVVGASRPARLATEPHHPETKPRGVARSA
jgi:integrase